MNKQRNEEILDEMTRNVLLIEPEVDRFVETMRTLDIRIGMHNYVGFDEEPIVFVVARAERATEIEALVEDLMGDKWEADSAALEMNET
jgi:hypothetical protein